MTTATSQIATLPKEELVHQLVRAKNYIKGMKAEAQHAGKVIAHTGLAALGGAVSGVLAVKMPKLPFAPHIDTDVALGLALAGMSMFDMFDGAGDYINSLASGLLAAGIARETQQALLARQTAAH